MRSLRCLTLALLALPLLAQPRARAQAVHAWEGSITIPTDKLGPADPNPPFPLVSRQPVYPYTMLDDLTSNRVDHKYRAIYLENQYLKITILPELGGHVYSVYDKIDKREVLYRDNVIKYGLVGPRGAWISGGMEFSFPYAHTTDTISTVESVLKHNPDGSATSVVGAMDWVSNMHWEIAITLRPDTARVEEGVTLFNSTPQNHLYLFWTNTAVKATDDTHYIYPMRETVEDDPYATVNTWPVWQGVDRSWYKNDPSALAIFGRDVQRNFFGVYYAQSNYGVVHVADYRQDPGKKLWTWGTARSGKIWDKILSDTDGSYNEIQSGRFYTQGYREFMNPRRVERWTEYWYPVRNLNGGYVEATPQMAMNVTYSTGTKSEVVLDLSPVAEVSGATLLVKQNGTLLRKIAGIHLTPLDTASYTIPLPDLAQAKKNLDVEIQSADGKTLLHWSAAAPVDGNPDLVPSAGKPLDRPLVVTSKTPVEELYLHGVFLQKTGDLQGAMKTFDDVLTRDPGYVPALVKKAWYSYGTAQFKDAEELLTRAEIRGKEDPSIAYAQGVVYRADGRTSLAKDAFWTAIHYGSALPAGPALAAPYVELGEIAIFENRPAQAVALLQRAIGYNSKDAFALADLAVAERLAGMPKKAAQHSAEAVEKMPLLPYALAENWQDNPGSHDTNWLATLSSDPENYLAVAAWYYELGASHSSDAVLHAALDKLPAQDVSPMFDYYLAANARREGNTQQAAQYQSKAASMSAAAVFPNRLSDVAVLSQAIRQNPADAQAKYALGNFLFAKARYDQAAALWQQSLAQGNNNPVLLRNLGLYQWRVKHNIPRAAELYSRAIQLSPNDYRLYTSLDEIYEQQGDTAARVALFKHAPANVLDQDTVRARRAVLLLEQSQPGQALALLSNHTFKPWEGGDIIRNMFVAAHMEEGRKALDQNHPQAAAQAFQEAMKYPEALGTGEPEHPENAEQRYWLGMALAAQNKPAEAQAEWKKAAAGSTVFSAMALDKLGRHAESRQLLDRIVQTGAKPGAAAKQILAAGFAEQYRGDSSRAKADFQRALDLDPSLWEARLALNGKSMARIQSA